MSGRAAKISVHRVRVPVTPRRYDVVWEIRIGGEPFARMKTIYNTWRCHRVDGSLVSGDFPTLAEARAWGLTMARRAAGLEAGPLVSLCDEYGFERPIGAPAGQEVGS
jgi:hypothetical protein